MVMVVKGIGRGGDLYGERREGEMVEESSRKVD